MNKRITSLFLSVVMICSLLVTAVPAWAAPGDSGVFASVTQAAPGDTFSVTLKVPGTAKPISDLSLKVRFDNTVFEVTEYTIPSIEGTQNMQSPVNIANEKGFFSATYRSLTANADIPFNEGLELTAYFKVKAEAPLGDYEFKLDESVAVGSLTDMGLPDILVPYEDFVNKSATIKVVGAPKPAESISLNRSELTLTVGDTETLVATVTPFDTTDTVAWSSDKTGVATVDPTGKVTAVAPGEAIITAKAGERTATCTVKVSCAHNLQTVPEKESNCTEKGWDEHQKCTLCGAMFNTSGDPIEEIPYRALNDDHDFNMGEWGYKGADGHAHVCTRNSAHHDTVVTHSFGDDDTCDICGYERTHVCANHLTKVEEKLADCTNPGNIEHYKCSCGKLYADLTANVPLTEEDVNRGALGHDWIDATCTEAKTCDRCGETEGTALGHDWEGEWSSNADNHWHACTRCDAKNDEADHTPDRAEATETDPIKCTVCDYVITPATGHVCANHLTKVDRVEPDCTTPGNIEHYKCSGDTGCGKLYKDADALVPTTAEKVKLDALGHDWKAATCTDPKTCDRCHITEGEALGHDWKDATCTDPKTCNRCHTTDGDALGHDWADTWSKDEHNHWHACTRCDAKADEAAHTPDHPDGATFDYPVLCVECGYEMEAQLEEGTIRLQAYRRKDRRAGSRQGDLQIHGRRVRRSGGIRAYNKHAGDQRCQDL